MATPEHTLEQELQERFKELHPVVQRAIKSSELEQHLRNVSNKYKLHLNQWQVLENEVMMALLGISPVEELAANIQKETGVEGDLAEKLATDVFELVFRPIRETMEQELATKTSGPGESAGLSAQSEQAQPITTDGIPETQEKPEIDEVGLPANSDPNQGSSGKTRPSSTEDDPGKPSTKRKNIENDPYREPIE